MLFRVIFFCSLVLLMSDVSLSSPNLAKEMETLFQNYELVMSKQNLLLIEDVFSENFLKESDGKERLQEKILSLNKTKKAPSKFNMTWKKGKNFYLMKLTPTYDLHQKSTHQNGVEFVIVREKGKLKIESTIGDGE